MKNKVLCSFDKFPLSVCAREGELSPIEKLIPATIEEDKNGLITFLPFVDPKDIYLSQHNNSIGETWREHNNQFAKYVYQVEKNNVVDVGGGSGNIYKSYIQYNNDVKWKLIDINPTLENDKVEIIRDIFNPKYINEGDTVITSHFLEHIHDLKEFLISLRNKNPKQHIFTLPNFKQYAKNNYSATLMFEHPYYLAEGYLEYVLALTGWKVLDKQYYKDHSIFFTTVPTQPIENNLKFDHSKDIIDFIQYMKDRVDNIKHIPKFYVFGAHFTYYYIINMGVSIDQIIAVIDNDTSKQNKRMYGTNTKIISASELEENAHVFVEMGPYNEEIKQGLNIIQNKIKYI